MTDSGGSHSDPDSVATEEDEGEDAFMISIPFAGARCENCDEVGEEGSCRQCGGQVPPPEESLDLVEARIKAMTPLLREIEALEAQVRGLAFGSTVVSADQFVATVTDLDIFGLMWEVFRLPRQVETLDFESRQAVGGPTRSAIAKFVPTVSRLVAATQELAGFDPEGPGHRLLGLTVDASRWAVGTVRSALEVVVAPSPAEARQRGTTLQEYMDGSPAVVEAGLTLDEVADAARPDLNSRLELVIERSGPFTDELGFLDFASVFGAFSSDEQPLESIDAIARQYFSDYLDGLDLAPGAAVLLALPMSGLAILDRPLNAHRVLRETINALRTSWVSNEAATLDVLRSTNKQAELVLGGFSRAQNGLRLLGLAEQAGWIDDDNAIMQVLNAYRELVEAPFRSYAWTVYCLRDPSAVDAAASETPPMVAELAERMAAAGHPLFELLSLSVDRGLRNAASHAQYRWVREANELEDLRTGQRWSLDELETAVADLGAALLGLDAGLACFAAHEPVASAVGQPLSVEEFGTFTQPFFVALFAAQGYRVLEIRDKMSTFVVDAESVPLIRAIPLVGGIAALDGLTHSHITLANPAGDPILSIAVEALREAASTAPEVKDIVVARLCRHVESDPRSDRDFAALLVALVAFHAVREMAEGTVGPDYLPRVLTRLEYIHGLEEVGASGARPDIARTISAGYQLQSGKHNMIRSFVIRLTRLLEWSAEHNLRDFG